MRLRSRQLSVTSVVALALTIQTIVSLFAAATPVLAPAILADRGWAGAALAFYPALIGLTQFAVSFIVPRLLSLFGGFLVCVLCLLLCAAGLVWTLVPNILLVALTPLLMGAALGSMNPASSELLGPRTTNKTAGLIMAIKQTGVPFGVLLAGFAVPALLSRHPWTTTVVALSAGGAGFAILLLLWRPDVDQQPSRGRRATLSLEPVRQLLVLPGMKRIVVASIVFSAMQVCLRSFLPVYLVLEIGGTLPLAGAALMASQAAGMAGQVFWATLADRWLQTRTALAMAGVAMATGSALVASVTGHWPYEAVIGVCALYGLGAAGFLPMVLAEIVRRSQHGQAGFLTTGFQIVTLPGVFAGPLVFGSIVPYAAYSGAFWVFAAVSLGCSGLLVYPRSINPFGCLRAGNRPGEARVQ